MKMIIALFCCSFLSSLALFVGVPGEQTLGSKPQTLTERDAPALWEQAIVAKGGSSKLYGVHNMVESYPDRSYVGLYVFPDKLWQWDDNRPSPLGLAIEMQNLERGLSYKVEEDTTGTPRNLGENSAKEVLWPVYYAELYYLLETEWIKPLPVKVYSASLGGRPVDVVQTIVHFQKAPRANDTGERVDFHLDKQSHLPLKVAFPLNDIVGMNYRPSTYYVTFSNYDDVNGIQMPWRVGHIAKPELPLSIQINVEYDPGIFGRPPSLKSGPDAWKQEK
jgi:hypothetical protein